MKKLFVLGVFVVFLFFGFTILAQIPQLLNYQGRLTDDVGSAITTTTGVRFSLYQGGDATTPGSGTLVYEESASVTPDDNGVFDHTIGTGTVIYGTLNMSVFNTAQPVFLEITVDPKGVADTLLPRKQVVTVGYSFKSELSDDADMLDGLHASDFALVGHHHDADYVNEGQADSVTSAMIVDGTIVDSDINAGANISASKINTTGLDADLLDGKDSLDFVHTSGDDMTGTLSVTTTGATYALYGRELSSSGYHHGVYGRTDSTSGHGVLGYASASSGTTYGVYGQSNSTSGFGVYGWATDSSGPTYGVFGQSDSTSGRAVYGSATKNSGTTYGVYGLSNSTAGRGVYGWATATSGTTFGVYGESDSPSGYGVYGTSPYYAVYGVSNSSTGYGVYGWASASTGTTYGVFGQSNSINGYGVSGRNDNGIGVFGFATSGVAVYGTSSSGHGIYGTSGSGYAGYFQGNAHVTGNLTVGGSKPCVQPIDNGKKVLLYAMESPEIWFEDFGTAELVNGRAVVQIERVFAQTANIERGYLIFLTPRGECQGLYISHQDKDSFEVRELGGGSSNISFYYRIVAKRKGYEDVRFEEFTEPEASPEESKLPIEPKAAKVKQPKRLKP